MASTLARGDFFSRITRNAMLLLSVPLPGVVTVTLPLLAPLGTSVTISVLDRTLNFAAVPLKRTAVAPSDCFPGSPPALPPRRL